MANSNIRTHTIYTHNRHAYLQHDTYSRSTVSMSLELAPSSISFAAVCARPSAQARISTVLPSLSCASMSMPASFVGCTSSSAAVSCLFSIATVKLVLSSCLYCIHVYVRSSSARVSAHPTPCLQEHASRLIRPYKNPCRYHSNCIKLSTPI
jgi:hypothetical protein